MPVTPTGAPLDVDKNSLCLHFERVKAQSKHHELRNEAAYFSTWQIGNMR